MPLGGHGVCHSVAIGGRWHRATAELACFLAPAAAAAAVAVAGVTVPGTSAGRECVGAQPARVAGDARAAAAAAGCEKQQQKACTVRGGWKVFVHYAILRATGSPPPQ